MNKTPVIPKTNIEKVQEVLQLADTYTKEHGLKLKGWVTYDGDFFDPQYLKYLCQRGMLVLNPNMGDRPEPEAMDVGPFKDSKAGEYIQQIAAENFVAPWYYKGQGKIMTTNFLAEHFKVSSEDVILDNFPITKQILRSQRLYVPGEIAYQVHADWWGTYFLRIAALCGKEYNERTFSTDDLHKLRQFLIRLRPRACVLSCISSDPDCPVESLNLKSITNLFSYPELKYFKLLFVSKMMVCSADYYDKSKKYQEKSDHTYFISGEKMIDLGPTEEKKVEWVLAYSR
ncbi:MAG: hypothetical protein V1837_06700 [Candidatus Woesearchaeota archaeon]